MVLRRTTKNATGASIRQIQYLKASHQGKDLGRLLNDGLIIREEATEVTSYEHDAHELDCADDQGQQIRGCHSLLRKGTLIRTQQTTNAMTCCNADPERDGGEEKV